MVLVTVYVKRDTIEEFESQRMLRVICGALLVAIISNGAALAENLGIYLTVSPFCWNPSGGLRKKDRRGISNCLRAKGLAARLKAEGERTDADLVLTVDISRIKELADTGLLAPLASDILNNMFQAICVMPMTDRFVFESSNYRSFERSCWQTSDNNN